MRKSIWLVAVLLLAALPASASDKEDAMVPVRKFIDSMNKNDPRAATATYAPQVSITDEFPPYYWSGNSAFADWVRDFGEDAKKNEITEPKMLIGGPLHADVTGDRAYVVVPATYQFRIKGKWKSEKGAKMTFALQKFADGWLINAWTYTKR